MLNKLKKFFKLPTSKTPKELASEKGEPYVNVITFTVDQKNPGQGLFELDYNEQFVMKLLKMGYKGNTHDQIVDQWFTHVCRNVALATYEQELADPSKRLVFERKELGGGRTEIS